MTTEVVAYTEPDHILRMAWVLSNKSIHQRIIERSDEDWVDLECFSPQLAGYNAVLYAAGNIRAR